MKNCLALCLVLLLLCASSAYAQEVTADISFEGRRVDFEEYNFSLFLPSAWEHQPDHEKEGYDIVYGLPMSGGELEMLNIMVQEHTGESLEEALGDTGITKLNGISYYLAPLPENFAYSGVTIAPGGKHFIYLVFIPNDEAGITRALEIMGSILPAGETNENDPVGGADNAEEGAEKEAEQVVHVF